jgi:3-oxoacyl-[acyl-carrier-protein] synthase-3
VPAPVVTNADLAGTFDTSDEWIRTRTGIRQRYVVDKGEATSDIAVAAGAAALKSADVDSVDVVVLATTTPDHPCPATAPGVARRLTDEEGRRLRQIVRRGEHGRSGSAVL